MMLSRPGRAAGSVTRPLRLLLATVLGLTALFVLTAMTIGFVHAGSPWVAWQGLRELGGSRFDMTETVPASGVQAGDVLALSDLTIQQRFAFRFVAADQTFACPVRRGGTLVTVRCPFRPAPPLAPVGGAIDIGFRLLLLCSGLLVLVRGRDSPSIAAGTYLCSEAMADTLVMTFAGLPVPVQVAGVLAARLARLGAYAALCAFALSLLGPTGSRSRPILRTVYALLLFLVTVVQLNAPTDLLFGHWLLPLPLAANYPPHAAIQIYALGLFAASAWRAQGERALALRVIFWAVFLVVIAFVVPSGYLMIRRLPPIWMFWFFNLAHAGAAVGFPWAILARKLVAVDFILRRAAVSLIAAGLVVCLINLLETAAENNIADLESSTLLQYAVPLAVGLSFGAIQSFISRGLEKTLYRDRLRAADALQALIARMPKAGDREAVAADAVSVVATAMRTDTVTIYAHEDRALCPVASRSTTDPTPLLLPEPVMDRLRSAQAPVPLDEPGTDLPGGMLFPLVVFGRLVGVLHCDRRAAESYDPTERKLLMEVARELAVALVWLREPPSDATVPFATEPSSQAS